VTEQNVVSIETHIEYLRQYSKKSIAAFWKQAEYIAKLHNEGMSGEDLGRVCHEGAGISYNHGTVWINIVESPQAQYAMHGQYSEPFRGSSQRGLSIFRRS
jgi:hypothetical protein